MANTSTATPKERLMAAIAPEVARIEQTMRHDLQVTTTGADPLLIEVLEYGLFNGGKRLRPLLFLLAAKLSGFDLKQEKSNTLYELAIAFEYLHVIPKCIELVDRKERIRGDPATRQYGKPSAAVSRTKRQAQELLKALVGQAFYYSEFSSVCQM